MNSVTLTGRLIRDALMNGNDKIKVLRMLVLCQHGFDKEKKEARQEVIPVKIFNPSDKLSDLLVSKGQGLLVEGCGHIQCSSYEEDGTTRYTTDVILNKRTFRILSFPKNKI